MKISRSKVLVCASLFLIALAAMFVVKMLTRRPESTSEVIRRMQQYQQSDRYDDAIALGNAWTEKHSQDGSNDQVFGRIASIYLEKARKDNTRKDEYIAQAIVYRDKMLPVAMDTGLGWYSIAALNDSVLVSEHAGDYSNSMRCDYYGNALKLLDRSINQVREKSSNCQTGSV